MKESILTLIEGSNGVSKPSKKAICEAVLDIFVKNETSHESFEFAFRDAVDQFAKDRFFEKHGTTEPLSWQEDAYQAGSRSPAAQCGYFSGLKVSRAR